ncbi:hypothetical protein TCAL_17400 [Tigriopus californicus]|uniref:HTH La-type RNA-binding domain-containing protein n=1 Tax=Tigriopus californicus TaxID=6832 RepID=A0A553NDM5_TIGCA|nr:la protein homolog [Tigriopus californicus]TRY63537.1 hypothetical protein TCAL_17400 [Tigriopus californicus]|eukprot:TCALIF_07137-PA protein Name:"Similar to La protein homolog (Aedes albopictus)" AED:0.00 eAED:0.00 QI:69/1/1/1/0.66/0.5/4/119/326
MSSVPGNLSALETRVINQMEHYFGDHNLARDRFMKRVMLEDDGWISMSVMLKFQRLASLSRDRYFIMRCVQKSESGLIEVDFDKERVRRKPAKPYSTFVSGEESRQLKGRIVHVRGFEKIATLNDIITFFEEDVKGVCRVNEEDPNSNDHAWKNRMEEKFLDGDSRFPESVCVVFDSDKEAKDFLARKVMFRGKKLTSELKFDSGMRNVQFSDTFDEDTILRTVWVDGFVKQPKNPENLDEFFSQFKGVEAIKKRKFRFNQEDSWEFCGSVFVTFDCETTAKGFLALQNLSYKGDRLRCMSQLDYYKDRKIFQREINQYLPGTLYL